MIMGLFSILNSRYNETAFLKALNTKGRYNFSSLCIFFGNHPAEITTGCLFSKSRCFGRRMMEIGGDHNRLLGA